MFSIGLGEIIVVLVVALMVFGPNKLPEVARKLGESVALLKRQAESYREGLLSNDDALSKKHDYTPPA